MRPARRSAAVVLSALALVAAGAAGCGGDSGDDDPGTATDAGEPSTTDASIGTTIEDDDRDPGYGQGSDND